MAPTEVDNRSGQEVAGQALAAQADFMLARLGLHPATELSVSLVDAAEMTDLHVRWLDLPGPTDVLSFPMDELRAPEPGHPSEPGMLGDVVICPQVAQEQGAQAGHGLTGELELLLTHGILHLLGHDHAEPEEHTRMFALQDQLLADWQERG